MSSSGRNPFSSPYNACKLTRETTYIFALGNLNYDINNVDINSKDYKQVPQYTQVYPPSCQHKII